MSEAKTAKNGAGEPHGAEGEAPAAAPKVERENEPKVMCYVSKEMVPVSETVEVEYGNSGKKFRIQPKYIRYKA